MKTTTIPTSAIATLSLLLTAFAEGQELILNRTFDSGISGWILRSTHGFIDWNPTDGNPGGAMSVTDASAVPTECFPIPSEPSRFVWSADVFQSSRSCLLSMVWFDSTDCTGSSFFELMEFEVATAIGSWQRVVVDLPQVTLADARSFQPIVGGASSVEPCLFDNVSFIQTTITLPPTSIPTLHQTGLMILGALVATVGVVLLRRRSW